MAPPRARGESGLCFQSAGTSDVTLEELLFRLVSSIFGVDAQLLDNPTSPYMRRRPQRHRPLEHLKEFPSSVSSSQFIALTALPTFGYVPWGQEYLRHRMQSPEW